MKRPDPSPTGHGSVSAGEVLTPREFGRRLGLATRALCDAQRAGLRTVLVGRVKFVLGADALAWFTQQAEQQTAERQRTRGHRLNCQAQATREQARTEP
jgi:hypothetical protein